MNCFGSTLNRLNIISNYVSGNSLTRRRALPADLPGLSGCGRRRVNMFLIASFVVIKNPDSSQLKGQQKLFDRWRGRIPAWGRAMWTLIFCDAPPSNGPALLVARTTSVMNSTITYKAKSSSSDREGGESAGEELSVSIAACRRGSGVSSTVGRQRHGAQPQPQFTSSRLKPSDCRSR